MTIGSLREWSRLRVGAAVLLAGLLALDLYAMYAEWFGWDRGGFREPNPVDQNWDARNIRGLSLAIPIAIALTVVVVAWPRIARRIRADLAELRRAGGD
jgi:ABC-type dipeptide/oligopeptide/nickel transport system permease subunit